MSFQDDRRRAGHRAGYSVPSARRAGIWTVEEIGREYLQADLVGTNSTTVTSAFAARDVLSGKTYSYKLTLLCKQGSGTAGAVGNSFTASGATASAHARVASQYGGASATQANSVAANLTTAVTVTPGDTSGGSVCTVEGTFVCSADGTVTPRHVFDGNGSNVTILAGSTFDMKAIN